MCGRTAAWWGRAQHNPLARLSQEFGEDEYE